MARPTHGWRDNVCRVFPWSRWQRAVRLSDQRQRNPCPVGLVSQRSKTRWFDSLPGIDVWRLPDRGGMDFLWQTRRQIATARLDTPCPPVAVSVGRRSHPRACFGIDLPNT